MAEIHASQRAGCKEKIKHGDTVTFGTRKRQSVDAKHAESCDRKRRCKLGTEQPVAVREGKNGQWTEMSPISIANMCVYIDVLIPPVEKNKKSTSRSLTSRLVFLRA